MTKIEEISKWIKEISFSDIPESVIKKAKYQILSVFSSLYSGANSNSGKIILKTIKEQKIPGNSSIIPDGEKTSIYNAVIANTSFSMAYDFDDYLFMGHPSHSAVLVPVAVAQELNLSGKDIITSSVISNEIAGRLGASCVIGPHNGQAWSFIHSISASSAVAKLLKLKNEQIENALSISLYQPNYVLFPGFITETKLLTAAIPATSGIFSAFLAKNGFKGPKDILENKDGFLKNFSFIPLPSMLTEFGKKWVLETISYKIYPGCAYIDSSIEAILEIIKEFEKEKNRKIRASDVKEIVVESTILTQAMENLTGEEIEKKILTPVLVNFSVALSIAVTIIAGRFTPSELSENFLNKNKNEILNLSKKVKIKHSPELTLNLMEELEKAGLLKIFLKEINLREILNLGFSFRKGVAGKINFELKDLFKFSFKRILKILSKRNIFEKSSDSLEKVNFKNLKMPFSANVKLFTVENLMFEKYIGIPKGAKGSRDESKIFELVKDKFRNEAEKYIGSKKVEEIIEMVEDFEKIRDINKFVKKCCII